MADQMMQAVRLHDYGGPDKLTVEEVRRPIPGKGQVLVHIKAAGINPADWKIGGGAYKQYSPLSFPWTPGLEAAGVVEEVGPEVKGFKRGQAVYGAFSGTYAEYAVASENDVEPKPANISFEEAASVPVGALTAWSAVINTANVRAEQKVLVQGGAGGVGAYAVQLARWRGAQVSATASEANLEFLRSLGVQQAIDYNAGPFESQVRDLDAVIDTVGGELAARSFKVIRPGGIYVAVAGRLPEGAGKEEGIRATGAGRAPTETLKQISQLIETGKLRPVVGRVFSLGEAPQAQAISQKGHGQGRLMLVMPN